MHFTGSDLDIVTGSEEGGTHMVMFEWILINKLSFNKEGDKLVK